MDPKLRILVVDDDPNLLSGTVRLMEQAGYETTLADTGGGALASLRANPPHLVLLDRQLPDVDGLEVCRQIKADPATAAVLVIMISGVSVRSDEQVAALATGADGYIARPIENHDLRVRIDAFARIARLNLRLAEENARRRALEADLEARVCHRTGELEASNQQLKVAQQAAFNSMRDAIRAQEQLAASNRQLGWEIAERQRAEAVLRDSEVQVRAMMNATMESIFMMDTEGIVLMANETTATRLGTTVEKLVGKNIYHLLPDKVAERRRPMVAQVVRTGQPLRFEDERLGRWIDQQLYPVFSSDGRVTRIVSFACDVTERKQVEEEAARAAREWQAIFAATNDAIWLLDQEHRVVRSNRKADQMFQCACGEAVGQHCWEVAHGTTEPITECPLQRAKLSLRRESIELPFAECWYQVTVDPILDPANQYVGAVHIISDITQRKRAEQQLQERERQLTGLLRNLPGLAYRCRNDRDRTMTFVSHGCLNLTGYAADSLLNNHRVSYASLIVEEDQVRVLEEVQKAVREQRSFQVTYRIRTATGRQKWVWERGGGVFAADGTLEALEGIITDTTEREGA